MTDTAAEQRATKIAGIRELATWLETHPEAPLPALYQVNAFPRNTDEGPMGAGTSIAELRRIGVALGVEPRQAGPHVEIPGPTFSGNIHYAAVVTNIRLEDFTEGGPCPCCGRPSEGHADADHCVCCTDDCGDRRGHVRVNEHDDNGSFYRCACGRMWPCEKASA